MTLQFQCRVLQGGCEKEADAFEKVLNTLITVYTSSLSGAILKFVVCSKIW